MSITVMKQWAEDVSKAYDVLAFGNSERALEILSNTRTSLRQAIANAEQEHGEPDKYIIDIECTKCGAKESGVLTVHTRQQPNAEQSSEVQKCCNHNCNEGRNCPLRNEI